MSYFNIQLECTRSEMFNEEGVVGQITIDSFSERFFSPVVWWTEDQYRSDWRRNIENFLGGADKAILLTMMYDLKNTNFLLAWTLYSAEEQDTTVYVQNHMVFAENFVSISDADRLVEAVHERETTTEDGCQISEWTTTVKSLEDFLKRQLG